MDVGPQRLAVAEAEEHLLVVADDHGALGHDQPVGHLLPDGHADVHAVHERAVVGHFGVDLHLPVRVDRGIDGDDAAPDLPVQVGEGADGDLLPRTEQPDLRFEHREADVEPGVVEQRAEFARRLFIDLLGHVGDLPGEGGAQRALLQAAPGAGDRGFGVGVSRADAGQPDDLGRRRERVAQCVALAHQHVVELHPRLLQRKLRLAQLKSVFARVEPGDRFAGPDARTVLRPDFGDGPRHGERQRAAACGQQPSVAYQLARETPQPQRVHLDGVVFDPVADAVVAVVRLFAFRSAAARQQGGAEECWKEVSVHRVIR